MGAAISINLQCISEDLCRDCRELEIDIQRTIFYGDDEEFVENSYYCRHKNKCERLLEHFEKVNESKNEHN